MEEITVPADTFDAAALLGDGQQPTLASVILLADDDEAYFSTGQAWVAER